MTLAFDRHDWTGGFYFEGWLGRFGNFATSAKLLLFGVLESHRKSLEHESTIRDGLQEDRDATSQFEECRAFPSTWITTEEGLSL